MTASGRQANPPAQAREAELVSAPALVDDTPPRVTLGGPKRLGGLVEVEVAADAASPLRRAEFTVDAGPWARLEPLHGVVQVLQQRFLMRVENLTPTKRPLVVRACDSAGNASLGKVAVG